MALIRGLMGLYPCPICFVPWDEQSDLTTENPLRTGIESQEILKNARAQRLLGEREEILKDHGLRDIDVRLTSFMSLQRLTIGSS